MDNNLKASIALSSYLTAFRKFFNVNFGKNTQVFNKKKICIILNHLFESFVLINDKKYK